MLVCLELLEMRLERRDADMCSGRVLGCEFPKQTVYAVCCVVCMWISQESARQSCTLLHGVLIPFLSYASLLLRTPPLRLLGDAPGMQIISYPDSCNRQVCCHIAWGQRITVVYTATVMISNIVHPC